MKSLKDKIINDPKVRKKLAWESHYYFFHIYFSEHITYPTAPFHEELFRISENIKSQFDEVVTFRGSAKTTIFSMSLPIWSILGKHQLKHIVLISRTQGQSRQLLMNIRSELENNELLKRDFNLKIDYQEEWSVSSLVLSQFGARISTYSVGESIRGVKHRQYRPQLIICDDIEDLSSIKTKESRDKTFNFISGEVIPAGDMETKIIMVGNLLHSDSVMMRYKELIENKELDGSYHFYPLLNDDGITVWPGKFTNQKSIATLQSKVGNIKTFQREYLLKIVSEEDQIVLPEWIKYYEELPLHRADMQYVALGVDLAISQKDTADKTAFVCAYIYGAEENLTVYISPYIMNRRLTFLETQQELEKVVESIGNKKSMQIDIEDVGYKRAAIEELKKRTIR
ncbi:hypothetical protein IPM65_02495 [Candidatus Roizmanbacteria bacterium]|nr:MAG: hypothetical protein IPM65_02495 [Candidatus Roizmanbacteria bacterium]